VVSLDDETRRLAARALEKQKAGQSPSRDEAAALRKFRKTRDDADRDRLASTVPKAVYEKWSGTPQKVLNEQAERHALPIGKGHATIDVREVLRAFHRLLAKHRHRLLEDDDDGLGTATSTAVEKHQIEFLKVRTARQQVALDLELGELVARHVVRDCLQQLASQLRAAGDRAERDHGREVRDLFNGVLEAFQATLRKIANAETGGEEPEIPPERD
jgi:hypothetical protein